MLVDGNISDLFFNSTHIPESYAVDGLLDPDDPEGEAVAFLACLERLGVSVPTFEELIEDFNNRV